MKQLGSTLKIRGSSFIYTPEGMYFSEQMRYNSWRISMTGQEFKNLVNPKNIYILISTDSEMIDLYIQRFKQKINAELVSYGQIKPYGKLFRKVTLNVLYMSKIDDSIFEHKEYIFIYTDSIDKRSSIYKKYKDQIIELSNNYISYIMSHSNMNEDQAEHFAKINNNDLNLIKSNLIIYNTTNDCSLITDNSSDIYKWVDSFIMKQQLPRVIESPISIMALLSTNCQNILKIKQNNLTGLNPYIINVCSKFSNYITEQELIQLISDCFYLDCQVKKGLIDINDTLNYLIARRYNNGTSD